MLLKKTIPSALVILLIAASCSNPATDIGVLPIEPILAGGIEIVSDLSGTRADVDVLTNIPVACAIVYGTDETFGSIAVDADMGGGAHLDHGPVLTGLTPDTDYKYVLQGSDADGNLYRSEVMSFRTPIASGEAVPGTNIAPEAVVNDSSSSFSSAFDASLAIDGDLGTEWSSAGDGDDAWIEVEFDSPRDVIGFAMRSRQMSDGTAIITSYTVTIDGSEVLGPFTTGTDYLPTHVATTGQSFRFDAADSSGGNTGAVEVEIYTN